MQPNEHNLALSHEKLLQHFCTHSQPVCRQTDIRDHDNGLSNDEMPQFASVDLTCDSMIGPPCEAYNFSDFIMFTILDTNLFM
jgi:hypothetical protein